MGRGRRTRVDRARILQATTVALTIALLLGSIPIPAALGAGPIEDTRRADPTSILPCEPREPNILAPDDDHRRPVQGGCRSWQSRSAPADAVALEPMDDGKAFLHARDAGDRIVVERRHAHTGSLDWRTHLDAPGDVGRLNLHLADASEQLYVGWENDDTGPGRPRAELGGPGWSPGGLARVSTTDGAVDWRRTPGSAGMGLAAEQDTLYYAYTEGGYLSVDDGNLEEDNATLVVTAVDPGTGETRWTNETDAWWTSHAFDGADPRSGTSCVDGPAHVEVADGIAYVARGQRCSGVPIAVVGVAPDGEMAFLSSYPDEHADTAWGDGRIWGSGLALHPNGRILYATASQFRPANAWAEAETETGAVVAVDIISGDVLWGWSAAGETSLVDTVFGEACGRWRPGCFADHGLHDLAVTGRGEVVLAGFDAMPGTDHDGPQAQMVVLDGMTGELLSPRERIAPSITDTIEMQTSGFAFDARVELGPDGVIGFAVYRTSQEVRLVGFPLLTDRAGPVWTAELPETSERPHVLDLAAGPDTVVVAGVNDTEQATVTGPPSHLSGYRRGLVDRMLSSMQTEVTESRSHADTSRRASSAATGIVHGKRVLQGVPVVSVNASDRVRAEVNISQPGEYYLLVEGVTPHQAYALDALPISRRGVDTGRSGACEDGSEADCKRGASSGCLDQWEGGIHVGGSRWGGGCLSIDESACETIVGEPSVVDESRDRILPCEQPGGVFCGNGTVVAQRHPTWRRKCWGTGREDPVTLARADAPAGEANDTEAGTVVLGPVVLTEGRYAVLEADDLTDDSGTLVANCVEATVSAWSRTGKLAACIEVHVRGPGAASSAGQPSAGPLTTPPGTTGTASHDGSDEGDRCPSRWRKEAREIPIRTFDAVAEENDRDERVWRADVLYLTFAARLEADHYGCYIADLDVRDARLQYNLHGERLFDGGKEWTAVIGVLGNCAPSWHVGCGDDEGSLMLRRPTVYLPDKTEGHGRLEVEAVHQAGHSESEEGLKESLNDLAVDIVSFWSDKPVDVFVNLADALGYARDELLPAWGDPFAGDDYPDYECGLGCQEWGVVQGAQAVEYVHRPFLRPSGCEDVRYPVKAGIQELFHAWADDDSGQGGTYYHQAFPLDLLERRIEVHIGEEGC